MKEVKQSLLFNEDLIKYYQSVLKEFRNDIWLKTHARLWIRALQIENKRNIILLKYNDNFLPYWYKDQDKEWNLKLNEIYEELERL